MSAQVGLDELIRNLKETSAIGDEQLKNTTKNTVNFIVILANNAYERRKPKITVTQKSNDAALNKDNPEIDVPKTTPDPEPKREYADIAVIRKTATLESESKPDRSQGDEEELLPPTSEEELPTLPSSEEDFSPQKSSGETLYKSSDFLKLKVSFKPGITGAEAQAILDLISSSEGSKINNGQNLLIKSGNKTLFETDAEGKVIYSANDRDRQFKANHNIPVVNSIHDLQQRATSIVRNEQSLRKELEVTRATGIEPPDRQF